MFKEQIRKNMRFDMLMDGIITDPALRKELDILVGIKR